METLTIDLPTMYGDHHVVEVRRMLVNLPGIEEVYASSAYRVLRVQIDPSKITESDIRAKLKEAGYIGELPLAKEDWKSGTPKDTEDNPYRHTAALEHMKSISFNQDVTDTGRALWPCPGMGAIEKTEEEA